MAGHVSSADRTPVAIVGAGPVGLSLALGLARHGVRSVLVERHAGTSRYSKAPGIHVRTREILRQWGVEQRLLDAGTLLRHVCVQRASGGRPLLSLDFADLDVEAHRPGLLILEQGQTERLLLEAVQATGLCEVRFRCEAAGLEASDERVRLTLQQEGRTHALAADFAVGCDGAGSFVRHALGLSFAGITYALRPMLADVQVRDERDALPWPRVDNRGKAFMFAGRLRPGLWRIVRLDAAEPTSDDVADAELRPHVAALLGEGPFTTVWASRFRIHRRSAPRFRVGRVLLAGDAAHVHSPVGGMGMNAGIQDAHNLAWKLAAALRGGAVDRLLDSYDIERRAVVVESVSAYTDLLTRMFLQAPPLVREAMFLLARSMLRLPSLRRRALRRTTMLNLDCPPSPLLNARDRSAGVRLPDVMLRGPDGKAVRLYDLLPAAPVLVEVASGRAFTPALPVEHVIRIGPAHYADPTGRLASLLGHRDGWILVRPDAHVAWARQQRDGLAEAIRQALGDAP